MILDEDGYRKLTDGFEVLSRHARPVKRMVRALVGRDDELLSLRASLARVEVCNVILLGDAGSGKTSLVQGAAVQDKENAWVEADLASMIASCKNPDDIGDKLKRLFREAAELGRKLSKEPDSHVRGVVLFVDEFHQVVEASPAAVEALKPALADSGTRGVKLVAATTLAEFRKWIMPNQPLMERLQRLDLPELGHDATVSVLRGMARTYKVDGDVTDPTLYDSIYEYSERFVPSSAQPRKSIMILDYMIGWHKTTGVALDHKLLAEVIEKTTGNRVELSIDASKIKENLDKRVLAQHYATSAVEQRLQLCVADINDPTRPRASFLLTGSTGTGKGSVVGTLIPTLEQRTCPGYTTIEDIRTGDHVFAPDGRPIEVGGTFPHDDLETFKVTFSDGRSSVVDGDHLWGVYLYQHDIDDGNLVVISTKRIMRMLSGATSRATRKLRFAVPMNKPVQWPKRDLPIDPYVMGAFIADGCMTKSVTPLTLSECDEFIVDKCADRLGASGYKRNGRTHNHNGKITYSYSWSFLALPHVNGQRNVLLQKKDVFGGISDVMDTYSPDRRIPAGWSHASVGQRWELVKGLFDCDGSIEDGPIESCRFNVSYSTSSEGLARDVNELLWSLGVASSITCHRRSKSPTHVTDEYNVHVHCANDSKDRFFSLPRKLAIANKAKLAKRTHHFDFDHVDIVSIEPTGRRERTICLYVDDPEHLYQSENFVVTHNTELVKQVSNLLFGDARRHLIRFDMSEFSLPESVERFRREMCAAVWERPFSVILLDEVEKAAGEITRELLQVLDDGRLTDENGRVVPFVNCYIFMTTNAGSEIYRTIAQYESSDTGDGSFVGHYDRLIRDALTAQGENRFPPELLGRIDCVIPFQPLSENTMERICKMKLRDLRDLLWKKHGVHVEYASKVLPYLVQELSNTDSNAGGARQIVSRVTTEISCAVARFVNDNPDIKNVGVKIEGTMAVDDKNLLEGDARVRVVGIKA